MKFTSIFFTANESIFEVQLKVQSIHIVLYKKYVLICFFAHLSLFLHVKQQNYATRIH